MPGDHQNDLTERVREALTAVIDPELGKNVVALGLIYGIEASDAGTVRITMTTTTQGCPASAFLVDAVRYATRSVEGVLEADVRLTHEPRWDPGMMAP